MEKEKIRTLRELEIGESVQVVAVGGEDQLRKHLLDMGLIQAPMSSSSNLRH